MNDIETSRYNYEYEIITKFNLLPYFNLIKQIIDYCNKNDILVGVGRGSCVGSYYAYKQGITKIDPIKYNLIFERFINPYRIQLSLPDIDIDVQSLKREQVINYIKSIYPSSKQIGSYTKNILSNSVRDLARLYNISVTPINDLLKYVENYEQLIANNKFLSWAKENNFDYSLVKKIEGLYRHRTVHPSGIVLQEIDEIPIMRIGDAIVSQWKDTDLAKLGYIKLDILGLNILDIFQDVINKVGDDAKIENINLEDQKVYKEINEGNTNTCFHLETAHTSKIACAYKVYNIEDLAVVLAIAKPALYRTGLAERMINLRTGKEKNKNEFLNSVLPDTYGIPIYQESFMKIITEGANLSFLDAEELRESIKKKKDVSNLITKVAIALKEKNININQIKETTNILCQVGAYCFNKSHAVSYAVMAYWSAFLKYYFPREYLTAYLNHCHEDKRMNAIQEIRRKNIKLKYPDINSDFVAKQDGNMIQLGLMNFKGIGEKFNKNNKSIQKMFQTYNIVENADLFNINNCDNCILNNPKNVIKKQKRYNGNKYLFLLDYHNSEGVMFIENYCHCNGIALNDITIDFLIKCKPEVDGILYDVMNTNILENCWNNRKYAHSKIYYYGECANWLQTKINFIKL